MTDERSLINPNTADVETLRQLPGVGPKLAQRILAARPFTSTDDLRRVEGVGPAFLERLRPLLVIADAAEAEEEIVQRAPAPEIEGEPPEIEPPTPPEPQPEAEVAPPVDEISPGMEPSLPVDAVPREEPAPAGRLRLLWVAFGSGLVAAILALALTLGVLANLNDGSLDFATDSQFKNLTRRMSELETRLDTLVQDATGLRARLDNLETLSKNISTIGESVEQLQQDVETASTRLQTLEQQMGTLGTQSDRFQGFLDGLRDLVDNVFPGEEEK
jgi:chaperonin cofactor prefoldin